MESKPGLKLRLDLSYHGADFHGWQVQPDMVTVQGSLKDSLKKIFGQDVELIGAGRTDTGVHAKHQVAHAILPKPFDLGDLHRALNATTPHSLCVNRISEVDEDFHARYTPHVKTYVYSVDTGDWADPLCLDRYHHDIGPKPDHEAIKDALPYIQGEHDFASFCSSSNCSNTTTRKVMHISWEQHAEDKYHLKVKGNGFLYNMIRIIAGTLLEVGKGQISNELIMKALEGPGNRETMGPTLPPHGLCLESIEYLEDDPH